MGQRKPIGEFMPSYANTQFSSTAKDFGHMPESFATPFSAAEILKQIAVTKAIDPAEEPTTYKDSLGALSGMAAANSRHKKLMKEMKDAAKLKQARGLVSGSRGRMGGQVFPGYPETTPTHELPPTPTAEELADPAFKTKALARAKASAVEKKGQATARKAEGMAARKLQEDMAKLDDEIELGAIDLQMLQLEAKGIGSTNIDMDKDTSPQYEAQRAAQEKKMLEAKKLMLVLASKKRKRARLAGYFGQEQTAAQEEGGGEVFFQKSAPQTGPQEKAIKGKFVKPKTPAMVQLPGTYEGENGEALVPEQTQPGATAPTPEQIREDYRAGKTTKAQARKLLEEVGFE